MMAKVLQTPTRFFSILPTELCLAAVLRSGQSFRWKQSKNVGGPDEWYLGRNDRTIVLSQTQYGVNYSARYNSPSHLKAYEQDVEQDTTLSFLQHYFALDVDLKGLYDTWLKRDPNFGKQTANGTRFSGIRILRQDPLEALICFISSSNNNIARITLMIDRLCAALGEKLPPITDNDGKIVESHSFPRVEDLAKEETAELLRELGFGYRAPYIQRSAALLLELAEEAKTAPLDYLSSLSQLPFDQARTILLKFVGVGPKVADCILLFGLGFDHIVPVDTHVYQIAVRDYNFKGGPKDAKGPITLAIYEKVQEKLRQIWGEKAGWQQQILFTADLKSFAEFADPLQTPAIALEDALDHRPANEERLVKPESPSEAVLKEKMKEEVDPALSMLDRVKSRKRKTIVEFTKSVKPGNPVVKRMKIKT